MPNTSQTPLSLFPQCPFPLILCLVSHGDLARQSPPGWTWSSTLKVYDVGGGWIFLKIDSQSRTTHTHKHHHQRKKKNFVLNWSSLMNDDDDDHRRSSLVKSFVRAERRACCDRTTTWGGKKKVGTKNGSRAGLGRKRCSHRRVGGTHTQRRGVNNQQEEGE